jgi:hypothetical protein
MKQVTELADAATFLEADMMKNFQRIDDDVIEVDPPSSDPLPVGTQVLVAGLLKDTRFNGVIGMVIEYKADKNRYDLLLAEGQDIDMDTISVKVENIVPFG